MPTFFDLLSLFYVVIGARALWTLVKNWRAFTDAQLTPFDKQLASQLAFFVFIPIGVLFHELGHAAATYQVGGSIDWLNGGFHYALFWGYVQPLGRFSVLQDWWIALSGNLVSVLYGFLPLVILPFANKSWLKYTLVTLARIQLGWSLIGYPLLTFAGFEGDWTTIYFANPVLGIPVFVLQVALIVALWLIDRSQRVRRWEMKLNPGVGEQLRTLDAGIARHSQGAARGVPVSPQAVQAILARGNFFASNGQPDLARSDYRTVLKLDPQNSRALFNLGQLEMMRKNYSAAGKRFRTVLQAAAQDASIAGRAHYGLALCLYQSGKVKDAIAEFDQAVALIPNVPEFYYWRGMAYRATRDNASARSDLMRAAELAATTNPQLAQQARSMIGNA